MTQTRPIIFGEVLFDCFPDGQSVMGGAPFNVAWHLQGLGCEPLLISSVGNDAHGSQVQNSMHERGLDTAALQINTQFPTGQVVVTFQDGQPSYEIVPDQAYDYIDQQAALHVVQTQSPALIYHGSLALRNEASRSALNAIVEKTGAPVFLDINLREPWWSLPLLDDILQRATWVKLNDEELCIVSRQALSSGPELHGYARDVFENYQLERLIVTRGEHGAFVLSKAGVVEGHPVPVKNLVDTVGAGDAFSAVTIAGILQDKPIQATLDSALAFASKVCEQQGATAQ
jgi:fructokinase